MPPLPSDQRRKLETAVVSAREAAEAAARGPVATLAVERAEPFASMDEPARKLRRGLRARARQLGDGVLKVGVPLLVEEIAYEQWHRMLFARFLAENGLLRHPSGVAVSLQDCAELAEEEGAPDAWELAARYASAMLPGLFRADDPSVQVRFAPEGRIALEGILAALPGSTFTADDALGWVYQFWQAKKKDEVNKSGRKIGGADLAPVTQLFTEDYMVRFLLENSLGAWWAARHPESPLLADWVYLRFGDDGTPAAGTFPGWPERAAEVTVMDPCCGSGHFLVAAFEMLRRMRQEEEGLGEAETTDVVLRDNLFGLELDPRCTQIAAFAVALAAWKAGGHPEQFPPRIACSGVPVARQLDEWRRLARGNVNLRETLEQLHGLFRDAPTLGSLIDPRRLVTSQGMFAPRWEEIERALERLTPGDEESAIFAYAAEETVRAAELLGRTYSLVTTNVPYLKRGNQDDSLKAYLSRYHDASKADLATAMLNRCERFCDAGGAISVVTPQNWLFLGSYKDYRKRLLETTSWGALARLGPGAFDAVGGEVVNVVLLIATNAAPLLDHQFWVLEASGGRTPSEKERLLRELSEQTRGQLAQRGNPDSRVAMNANGDIQLLKKYADSYQGICTGDYPRFGRTFWEFPLVRPGWIFQLSTVESTRDCGGREHVLLWEDGKGALHQYLRRRLGEKGLGAWVRGLEAWGLEGVAVSQMGTLPVSRFLGESFDNNVAVIVPKEVEHLGAIWAFCRSGEHSKLVREIDRSLKVTNQTLLKVPFDLERWQKVADETGPLPKPHSSDPTQWLFEGHPADSSTPLQVAVVRLLGYRWPQQGEDDLGRFADRDGIVCLPPVGGEQPAADRLRSLLAAAYGPKWSPTLLDALLAEVGYGGKDLTTWLRDGFFAQHCKLFHNRPFIWHIWDGRKDGFSALVNYHRLDAGRLEKLTYTYLGSWIAAQKADAVRDVPGALERQRAAQELQRKLIAIREGEPPYDIYVRWKPLHEQPIGWDPDLNDGVRLNVRPFVTAGVLRSKFTVKWNKDRGTNPDGSERLNDLHLTRVEKLRARDEAATVGAGAVGD